MYGDHTGWNTSENNFTAYARADQNMGDLVQRENSQN